MTFKEIEEKANKFFEFPSDDKRYVTTTSAILFAQYILQGEDNEHL
jgi:hypothetical protein